MDSKFVGLSTTKIEKNHKETKGKPKIKAEEH